MNRAALKRLALDPGSSNPGGGIVDRLAARIGNRAGAAAVFGPAVARGDVTVIPVAASRFGFGGGSGPGPDGSGEAGGGGGGASSRPLGFIEIRGDRARFRAIRDPLTLGLGALALAMAAAILARSAGRLGGGCRLCARRQVAEPDRSAVSNEDPIAPDERAT